MDKVERAIELLVQTQQDVVVILQSNIDPFGPPMAVNSADALANAAQAYNDGVSDVLDILHGE